MKKSLGALSLIGLAVTLYFALFYAPEEATMGRLYRIIYFHVPQAIASYLSATLLFIASVLYLATRNMKWDRLALCAGELGLLFTTTTLLTGMIWGRLAWNTWWAGDARLTLELILGLFFVGYLMLRSYLPEREKKARLSTIFGFLAMLNVPINYGAIYWWNTQHPKPVLGPAGGGMEPEMKTALLVAMVTFGVVYAYLLTQRLDVATLEDEVGSLEAAVEAR